MSLRMRFPHAFFAGSNPPRRNSLRAGGATPHRIPHPETQAIAVFCTGCSQGGNPYDAPNGLAVGCLLGILGYRNRVVRCNAGVLCPIVPMTARTRNTAIRRTSSGFPKRSWIPCMPNLVPRIGASLWRSLQRPSTAACASASRMFLLPQRSPGRVFADPLPSGPGPCRGLPRRFRIGLGIFCARVSFAFAGGRRRHNERQPRGCQCPGTRRFVVRRTIRPGGWQAW